MGRTLTTALITIIAGLLVGMGIGGFLTYTSTAKYLSGIPGAPIVVGAKYNKEKNALVLSIFNSGGLPLTVVSAGLVYKPVKGEGYTLTNIPVNVNIPSGSITEIEIKLKENSSTVKGDILSGSLVYNYPYIPQIYTTTFSFTVGKEYQTTPTEVIKKASEEAKKAQK